MSNEENLLLSHRTRNLLEPLASRLFGLKLDERDEELQAAIDFLCERFEMEMVTALEARGYEIGSP